MNKKILIYGGSSLISLELIKIYNNEEYEFIIFCRNKNKFIERLKELDLSTNKFTIFESDLIELEKNLKIISEIKNDLDGLIWVAGETGDAIIEFENTAEAKKSIDINFLNPILIISKLTLKIKQNNNSFIAVITSVAGLRGRQKNFFYGSANSGMISFLSGLRQKFSGKISVLTIIPGYMKTKKFNIDAPELLVTSPKKAARIIDNAIKNKKEVVYINFLWRVIMFFLGLIPEKIFKNFKF